MNAMLRIEQINQEKTRIQAFAVRAILKGFKKNYRGKCIMACGTGKTRVAFMVIAKRSDEVTVICVPSLGLVSQFLKDCQEHAPKHRVLPVCSKMHGETPEDYEIAHATTSPAVIAETLSTATKKSPVLVISTYQSYLKLCEANETAGKEIGLLVSDEAHNTAGPNGKKMSHCIHDSHMQVTNRLFLTATPRLYSGSREESASMDDESLYGPEFFQFSFAKALECGIVCDYEIHIVDVLAIDSLRKIRQAEHPEELSEIVAAHVASQMKSEDRGRVFVFHTRIERSEEFNRILQRNGVHSACITGKDPVKKREKILKEFEDYSASSAICSVRVFGEGIDAPSVNRIVIADPMTSTIQIAQAIGRGTRVELGKEKLVIYIPVFVDAGANGDEDEVSVESSPFRHAVKVLNAMRSIDETLNTEIRDIVRGNGGGDGFKRTDDGLAKWKRLLTNLNPETLSEKILEFSSYMKWKRWSPEVQAEFISSVESFRNLFGKYPTKRDRDTCGFFCPTWISANSYFKLTTNFGSLNNAIVELCGKGVVVKASWGSRLPEEWKETIRQEAERFKSQNGRIPSRSDVDTGGLPCEKWQQVHDYLCRSGESGLRGFLVERPPKEWNSDYEARFIMAVSEFQKANGSIPTQYSGYDVFGLPCKSWGSVHDHCERVSPHGTLHKTIKALFPNGIK
jgi:predicted helicase